jgi:hypothetical protein
VAGIDLDVLLLGVLAAALRGHRGRRPLENLEQRLLHPLAGDVARDRRVLALAGDLVDLVDVDDPPLAVTDVEVGRLQQAHEDILHVLTHVPRLGERGRVDDGEGDLEDTGQRLRQQRLADAGGAYKQDVGLLQLHVLHHAAVIHPAVVVVDGDGERLLRLLLADHVLVQDILDLARRRKGGVVGGGLLLLLLGEDLVTE